jgi:hypothetical protein
MGFFEGNLSRLHIPSRLSKVRKTIHTSPFAYMDIPVKGFEILRFSPVKIGFAKL